MRKEEEQRINKFFKSLLDSDKRLATQLPGDEKHTIVIPMEEVLHHWSLMVKDLEDMNVKQES